MTKSPDKKPKKKKEEVDFTNITPDDIARRFLETPPKPKKRKSSKRINKMIKYIWRKIEPLVDLHITSRIVTFHNALVDRGQIKRPPKEELIEKPIDGYSQDYISQ